MKVKCFGGVNNTKFADIESFTRVGDKVRVRLPVEFKVVDFLPNIDEIPRLITQQYEFYILEAIDTANVKIYYYLRHENFSMERLLTSIFAE